ncbi:uncharacterized protein LOC114604422 [Podarcis muralis]
MFNPRGNMPPRPRGPNAPGPMPRGPFLGPGPGPGPDGLQRQHLPAPPRMPQRVMEPEMRARFPRPNVQVTQHGMDPRQERHQREEGCATHFPLVSSSQITSGEFAQQATRIQNRYTTDSASSVLASFGLSNEDLEELSRYPDDQLTPENMPLILRDIRVRKMTHQLPSLPSQSREKEMFHSDDGRGSMVKCKVIDYGHKSQYKYTETLLEVKDYNSGASTEGNMKGFPTQQTTLVSSAPSGVTSSQMKAVEEVLRKMGFQRSTSSTQSFPPMDASKKGPGLGLPPAGAEIPPGPASGQKKIHEKPQHSIESPVVVVKASWLPVFSQADVQKLKRLPTPSMMNDYYAASPRIFPHVCSLCNVECEQLKGWNLHVRTAAHSKKCDELRQRHPEWNPEDCPLLQRHEGDKKEKHIPMPCSTSSNPNASEHSISGHASSQTRSRSRSPGPHSRKRSRSRSSERCRRKRSRSRSSERSRRKRTRSRSSERSRRKRTRSRSSERSRRKRTRSRSSERSRRKRTQSRSSERCRRKRSRSRSPGPHSRKWSRSRSPGPCSRKRSLSRSRRHRSRSSERRSSPSSSSQTSSSQKRELRKSTRSPASSAEAGSSKKPPAKSALPAGPMVPSVASFMPPSSESPSPSMMNDYHAVSPTVLPHVCSLCKIECSSLMGWNLHVRTAAHSEKCDELRQQYPDWNPEECSLLQRHEGDKKEKHIPMPCSTSSNPNASEHSISGHASSQTGSRSRNYRRRSRSSERPSSPSSSSQSSSSQKRELGKSTESPASSAEAGSSRKPPAKSALPAGPMVPSVASFMPPSSESPSPSMMNDYHAVSPTVLPHMCSLCKIECSSMMGWNLHVGSIAHFKKCDELRQQYPDWNPEEFSLLQRHEGEKKEKHIPMPCSTSSNPNTSQHSIPGHASSQTRSRSRSPGPHSRKRSRSRSPGPHSRKRSRSRSPGPHSRKRSRSRSRRHRSRSSERRSSPSSSSQTSSSQKRELRKSTRSPASSAEAGSSRKPPAKSDVAEQPPKKSEHPLQTKPGHQEPSKKEAAMREQGDQQLPSKSDVAKQPPNKPEHPLLTNPGHQELPKKEAATEEQADRQPPAKSDVAEQPPKKSEHPLQTNPDHQELPNMEAAMQGQGDRQREDHMRFSLTPFVEQSVMQALSLLQPGGTVGAGLTQGTSLPPLPALQIEAASLSLVSMMQLVATQVLQAALSVQESPSVAGPSPQLSIPAGSEEKKQESSQEVVPGVVPPCSGLAPVRIWIVGHSIVHWASLRAAESELGHCLGLPNHVSVSWMSRCGMRWDEFLPMVRAKVSCEGPPAAMVVQLGENDLVLVHSLSLRSRMQEDLEELVAALPGLKIFWSQLLQRRAWLGSNSPTATERTRKRTDSAVSKKVVSLGGTVIRHAGINFKDAALYRPDGVNLSNAGNDVWLSNVSVGLMGWLQV